MAVTMDGIFVNGEKATFRPEDILSGDASAYTEEIGAAVEAWMEENVTGGEQVTDTTLTLPGVPADAKATGDKIGELKEDLNVISEHPNLFDATDITSGYRLKTDGTAYADSAYFISAYVPVSVGVVYTKNSPTVDAYHRLCTYNASKVFVRAVDDSNSVTIAEGEAFIRFSGLLTEKETTTLYGTAETSAVDKTARTAINELNRDIADIQDEIEDIRHNTASAKIVLAAVSASYIKNPAVGSAIVTEYSNGSIVYGNVISVKEGKDYIIECTYDSIGDASTAVRKSVIRDADNLITQIIDVVPAQGETVQTEFTAVSDGKLTLCVWNRCTDIKIYGETDEDESGTVIANASFQNDFKTALMTCLAHIAWTDEHGETYAQALLSAMRDIESISASFASGQTVYEDQSLYEVKQYITVTVNYTDSTTATATDFTVSGSLNAGKSELTITCKNLTTKLTVTVTAKTPLYRWDFTQSNIDEIQSAVYTLSSDNTCLTAQGLTMYRNLKKGNGNENCVVPLGGRAKISFGTFNRFVTDTTVLISGLISMAFRTASGITPVWSFYYGGGWHDTTVIDPNYFSNKTLILDVESDGTVNVYCGDELIHTAESLLEEAKTVTIGNTSTNPFRCCFIKTLTIYDVG